MLFVTTAVIVFLLKFNYEKTTTGSSAWARKAVAVKKSFFFIVATLSASTSMMPLILSGCTMEVVEGTQRIVDVLGDFYIHIQLL